MQMNGYFAFVDKVIEKEQELKRILESNLSLFDGGIDFTSIPSATTSAIEGFRNEMRDGMQAQINGVDEYIKLLRSKKEDMKHLISC
jgi:hypothetical protein